MTSPIVRGSAYTTMVYDNLTPAIYTIHAILSVNDQGNPGEITGNQFLMRFNNGQSWKVYVLGNATITLRWSRSAVHASDKFSGVLRVALVHNDGDMAVLDDHSETYPIGGNVVPSVCSEEPDAAFVVYNWETRGGDPNDLLMMALPHHMDALVQPNVVMQNSYRTVKGEMSGILGNTWTLKETLTQIGWSAPRAIDPSKREAISNALQRDKYKRAGSYDTYWNGKELGAMGRLILIAEELQDADTAAFIRGNLKEDLDRWLFSNNSNPLMFDTTWKGICSANGMDSPNNDYGQGWYNDHHFHYGYFVYAAAVLGKRDREWLLERKEKILALVRDYANPSSADPYFPVTRNKDWFDGHSWAAGLFAFGDSKNQESTSEAINSYYAISLLGESLGDDSIKLWGKLLLATELRSVHKYWQIESDGKIYPDVFAANKVVGVLWSSKVDYATFFGNNVEFIHCIQMMPFTPISEDLLRVNWIREEYPVVSTALTRMNPPVSDDWKVFIFLAHSILDKEAAWSEVQDIKYFDNGNTMTNTLYFVATRPT
jgi:endo-1,3(4)-beta-glucanase